MCPLLSGGFETARAGDIIGPSARTASVSAFSLTEPAGLTEKLEAMGDGAYGLSQICRLFHDSAANRLAVKILLRRRRERPESECPEIFAFGP
jgi:hypothetical protein